MMNKRKAVLVLVATLVVAIAISGWYIHTITLPQQEQARLEGMLTGYELGFENAFAEVVECYVTREGITERDAEWASEWQKACEEDKHGIIEAIIMGDFIPFSNVFLFKFVNLSGENTTFLDMEKKKLPCGRDVLTGECVDEAYNTPYHHMAMNWSGYEYVRIIGLSYNASQVEDITVTEGLGNCYIIYIVKEENKMPKKSARKTPVLIDSTWWMDDESGKIDLER